MERQVGEQGRERPMTDHDADRRQHLARSIDDSQPRLQVPLTGQLSNRQFGRKLDDLLRGVGPAGDMNLGNGPNGDPRVILTPDA